LTGQPTPSWSPESQFWS